MTVYEMIQELSQYDSNTEVEINVVADEYRATVQVEEDVKEGEETDVDVEIDEDISGFSIEDYKKYNGQKIVRILVEVE